MSRNRDGEYMALYWDGSDPDWEVVRGHVSAPVAAAVVNNECGIGLPDDVAIEHRHARWIPAHNCDYDIRFEFCEPGRGAFPVTLVHDGPERAE